MVRACARACMCACVRICVCVRMCACMCMYVCVHVHMCACARARTCVCTRGTPARGKESEGVRGEWEMREGDEREDLRGLGHGKGERQDGTWRQRERQPVVLS